MYSIMKWVDHIVTRPRTYTSVTNPDGSRTDTPAPGTVVQQGTPQSATNLNNLETGVGDAHLFSAIFIQFWMNFKTAYDAVATMVANHAISLADDAEKIDNNDQRITDNAVKVAVLEADDNPEIKTVTLTNTAKWPFNNSVQTVALAVNRTTLNYTVDYAITSIAGGIAEKVRVTERMANGFKVEFDGNATSVVLKMIIKGGITR